MSQSRGGENASGFAENATEYAGLGHDAGGTR